MEIPKLYYINLKGSKERNTHMIKFFNDLSENINSKLRISRISALDSKNTNIQDHCNLDINLLRYKSRNVTSAEFCCTYSHLTAMKEFITDEENTDDYAFICEDDLSLFNIDYKHYFNYILSLVKETNPKIISVFCGGSVSTLKKFKKITEAQLLNFSEHILYGTGCYLISRNFAEKLVSEYFKDNKLYIDSSVVLLADQFIYNYAETTKFLLPPLFSERDNNRSLIHQKNIKNHVRSKNLCIEMWKNIKTTCDRD